MLTFSEKTKMCSFKKLSNVHPQSLFFSMLAVRITSEEAKI